MYKNLHILISNKNAERQWNQRRGRIVRTDPNDEDKIAVIFLVPAAIDGTLSPNIEYTFEHGMTPIDPLIMDRIRQPGTL